MSEVLVGKQQVQQSIFLNQPLLTKSLLVTDKDPRINC